MARSRREQGSKRRKTHNVHITELVQPEVVHGVRRVHEVALRKLLVDLFGSEVHLLQNPLLDEALVARGLPGRISAK